MKGIKNEYRRGLLLLALCGILLQSIFFMGNQGAKDRRVFARTLSQESVQEGIAGEILRFHVLANSDSAQDQALKGKVKDHVLEYLQTILEDADSAKETERRIRDHMEQIRREAEEEIKRCGYDYDVQVRLETCYFPVKSYGDCTFPAGNYRALRILIGQAKGHNWWCVLYPNLCFVDSIHAVVPEEEKQELKNVLTEEEYDSLFDWKEDDYQIQSGFRQLWEKIKSRL